MIKREGRWRRIHYKGSLIKFQEFRKTEKKMYEFLLCAADFNWNRWCDFYKFEYHSVLKEMWKWRSLFIKSFVWVHSSIPNFPPSKSSAIIIFYWLQSWFPPTRWQFHLLVLWLILEKIANEYVTMHKVFVSQDFEIDSRPDKIWLYACMSFILTQPRSCNLQAKEINDPE